ncbi:hypothetical protein N9R27_02640 [Flavobacteriaceae bacterium]|nr:hypothetical protein [Flavobacteriaceae bacterium]
MARRKRATSTFNLSFLDVMSCGFGAVVLVFLVIDHSVEVESQRQNTDVLSEINLLEIDIRDGEAGLVALRNAVSSTDLEIVAAQGLATRVTDKLDEYEALVASLEEAGFSESTDVETLKAEINRLETRVQELREASEAEAGRSAREFIGEGNRQYLTGMNLGGRHIAILIDTSASMLDDKLVNVIRLRNMNPTLQRNAAKWRRSVGTVDWLTAQLPIDARYQVIGFNTQAAPIIAEHQSAQSIRWLEVADTATLTRISDTLAEQLPAGGTSLHQAFAALSQLTPKPDNIFLITDGLPTQGDRASNKSTISGADRLKLYRESLRRLPSGVPVNIILAPMEGDPRAASEFWQLAQTSGGSFMSPSKDWP